MGKELHGVVEPLLLRDKSRRSERRYAYLWAAFLWAESPQITQPNAARWVCGAGAGSPRGAQAVEPDMWVFRAEHRRHHFPRRFAARVCPRALSPGAQPRAGLWLPFGERPPFSVGHFPFSAARPHSVATSQQLIAVRQHSVAASRQLSAAWPHSVAASR